MPNDLIDRITKAQCPIEFKIPCKELCAIDPEQQERCRYNGKRMLGEVAKWVSAVAQKEDDYEPDAFTEEGRRIQGQKSVAIQSRLYDLADEMRAMCKEVKWE